MTKVRRPMFALLGTGAFALAVAVGTAAQAAPETALVMTDGAFSTATIRITAGQSTVITVKNAGSSVAEFESKRLRIEQVIAPGATSEIRLPALPEGAYPFTDEFHQGSPGAKGQIVAVKAPAS